MVRSGLRENKSFEGVCVTVAKDRTVGGSGALGLNFEGGMWGVDGRGLAEDEAMGDC